MFKKFKFLRSGISSAADIEAALTEYDIVALEASLANAQQRRTDLLLTGDDSEILKAEDDATKARLAVDRARAAVAELNKRLTEVRKTEALAAIQNRRNEAVAVVDKVIARIEKEYVAHARAIAEIVEEAKAADIDARSFNNDRLEGEEFEGFEPVGLVHERLGWHKKYPLISNDFAGGISLPRVGGFPGVGDAANWVTRERAYALYGIGNPNNFEEAS
jgi:hypothetical protein